MKLTAAEKKARADAAAVRRKAYDRKRYAIKRAAEKLNPPPLTAERLERLERRKARVRARWAEKHAELAAKPIVIAKPRSAPAYHRWSPETEAVNPNNVPVTRLPTPPARVHVEAPSDGFAAEWRRLRA